MALGGLTRLGLAIEAAISAPTYPGAAATIATLVPIMPPQPDIAAPVELRTSAAGYGLGNQAVYALPTNTLTLALPVVYDDLEPLWVCGVGYMAKEYGDADFPETVVSGAYRHRYECPASLRSRVWHLDQGLDLDDGFSLDDRHTQRLTLAGTLGDLEAWEWSSAMVQRLTLSGGVNRPLRAEVTLLCGGFDATPSANTLSALQALVTPAQPRVLWHQGVTSLAPYSSSTALDSGDVVSPDSFTLTIDTTLERRTSARSFTAMEEPMQARASVITGTLGFPLMSDTTRALAQRSETRYMASIVFTGGQIAATGQNYSFEVYLPSLVLTGTGIVWNGAGQLTEGVSFLAESPGTAAAGMPATENLTPLIVQVVSSRSTHPLV